MKFVDSLSLKNLEEEEKQRKQKEKEQKELAVRAAARELAKFAEEAIKQECKRAAREGKKKISGYCQFYYDPEWNRLFNCEIVSKVTGAEHSSEVIETLREELCEIIENLGFTKFYVSKQLVRSRRDGTRRNIWGKTKKIKKIVEEYYAYICIQW